MTRQVLVQNPNSENYKNNNESLAQVGDISGKFVPLGNYKSIVNATITGLIRLRHRLRWHWYWKNQNDFGIQEGDSELEIEQEIAQVDTLNSGLKLPNYKSPRAKPEEEYFLKTLERDILHNIRKKPLPIAYNTDQKMIKNFIHDLSEVKDSIFIKTDKTNSRKFMGVGEYKNKLEDELSKKCTKVSREEVVSDLGVLERYVKANKNRFGNKEFEYVLDTINRKLISTPTARIKDHKNNDPLRLIIPADNFTANLSKVLISGLKRIFAECRVDFKFLIENSYSFISDMKELKLKRSSNRIILLDISDMYASFGIPLIRKAINFYIDTYRFDSASQNTCEFILKSFELIMNMNYSCFGTDFYRYTGKGKEGTGLTMGGYESCFLSDLVVNYIYQEFENEGLFEDFIYNRTYRDDGALVTKEFKSEAWLVDWKRKVDLKSRVLTNDRVAFTIEVEEKQKFLDIETFWDEYGNFSYQVYLKPNQKIQYLNSTSMHTRKTLQAIPRSVITRLVRLSSDLDQNSTFHLRSFPIHKEALRKSGLVNQTKLNDTHKASTYLGDYKKGSSRHDKRTIHFVIPYMKPWLIKPIHVLIKENLRRFDFNLRISMSYSKMPDLDSILKADAESKLTADIADSSGIELPCNCHGRREKGCVLKGGGCRKIGVIYGMKCTVEVDGEPCGKVYVGSTNQRAKIRVKQHMYGLRAYLKGEIERGGLAEGDCGDDTLDEQNNSLTTISALANTTQGNSTAFAASTAAANTNSDTYIRHMISHNLLGGREALGVAEIRDMTECFVIKDIKPIRLGTINCSICSSERIEIFMRRKSVMNSRTEIFGACRHKPKLINPIKILATEDSNEENQNEK